MENEKVVELLTKQLQEIQTAYMDKVVEQTKGKADITEVKTLGEKLDFVSAKLDDIQAQVDKVDKAAGDFTARQEQKEVTFGEAVIKGIRHNAEAYKNYKPKETVIDFKIESKSVGVMTISNNLVGSTGVPTYASGIIGVTYPKINLNDLIMTIPSATDAYHYIRHDEEVGEGSFDWDHPNSNIVKPQRDYDFTDVTVNLQTLAATTKVTRNMLRNIPALETYLSQALPRDYYKAENTKGYAALVAAASTVGSTDGGYSGLLETIGILGDIDYDVTGIATRPSVVYALLATRDDVSGFTVPGAVSVDNFGILRVSGVPVFKASWVAADKAVLGDWQFFKKVMSEGLNVRSTEFDQDDFVKNRVTFRTEATIGFAIERPAAFSVIDMGFSA